MWRKFLMVWLLGAVTGMGQAAYAVAAAVPARDALGAVAEGRRIALVIGNGAYPADPLGNPARDAATVSRALRALGFEVQSHTDLDAQAMRAAIADFRQRLEGGGAGLFYFAGHGLRMGEQTLLAPVDADRHTPARLVERSVALTEVLGAMAAPRPGRVNLVILDTCLDDPFRHGAPAAMEALPADTLLALATAPGARAGEGAGLGRYTEALLRALAEPEQDLGRVFAQAARRVSEATGQAQQPAIRSSLTRAFSLGSLPGGVASATGPLADESVRLAQSRGILPKDSAEQYELTFWESIKDSQHAGDYEAYLKAYPNGRFAPLARTRIERLRAAAPKTETPPSKPAPAAPAAAPAPERPRPQPAAPAPERAQPAAPAVPAAPRPAAPAPAAPAAPAAAAPAPDKPVPSIASGTDIKDCPTCPALIGLRQGEFVMGSNQDDPSERPAHPVSIARPFAIAKFEVTNEQWNACVDAGACQASSAGPNAPKNLPVSDVSWNDAQSYVKWLSKLSGKSYRLPTEAEWEYAVRGGTSGRHWWGDKMATGKANCKVCGEPWNADAPAPAGSFAANPYGLHDMNGSVWEWVADCWHSSYKGAPADGRAWDEPNCRIRVIRGGSWRDGADYMLNSTRFKYDASVRHSQNGFRVARDLP